MLGWVDCATLTQTGWKFPPHCGSSLLHRCKPLHSEDNEMRDGVPKARGRNVRTPLRERISIAMWQSMQEELQWRWSLRGTHGSNGKVGRGTVLERMPFRTTVVEVDQPPSAEGSRLLRRNAHLVEELLMFRGPVRSQPRAVSGMWTASDVCLLPQAHID